MAQQVYSRICFSRIFVAFSFAHSAGYVLSFENYRDDCQSKENLNFPNLCLEAIDMGSLIFMAVYTGVLVSYFV
jgi:hypothetical protein